MLPYFTAWAHTAAAERKSSQNLTHLTFGIPVGWFLAWFLGGVLGCFLSFLGGSWAGFLRFFLGFGGFLGCSLSGFIGSCAVCPWRISRVAWRVPVAEVSWRVSGQVAGFSAGFSEGLGQVSARVPFGVSWRVLC